MFSFLHSLTLRSTLLLVSFVCIGVALMASLSFISLNQYTSENSQLRIERAAQAAASLFEASLPGEVVTESNDRGLPSAIRLQGADPLIGRETPEDFDKLVKDISKVTSGASNLFSWNEESSAFDRFATTFRRPDGSMPPAFSISSGHPAYDAISESEVYRGDVPVMGRMRYAYLTPILFYNGNLAGLLAIDVGWSDDLTTGQETLKRKIFLFASVILAATSVMGGLLHWYMLRPLPSLSRAAHRIAEGTQGTRVIGADRKDEIGNLAKGLQKVDHLYAELDTLAYTDSLTGLGNRAYFRREMRREYSQNVGRDTTTVILLDIDRFRSINEGFGTDAGDKVLIEVSRRLKKFVGLENSVFARFGSNEFVILTNDFKFDQTEILIDDLRSFLAAPYSINGSVIELTFTIGVVSVDVLAFSAEETERNVQLALKAAKAKGAGSFEIFDPDFAEQARHEHESYISLRQALTERKGLCLYFQAQASCKEPEALGVEALVRWPQDDGSILMPLEIIPIAEANGLMVELGSWVLDEACRHMREWIDNELPISNLAVNVSPVQLWQPDFVDVVRNALDRYQVPPHKICLEITEEVFVNFSEDKIQTVFFELRSLGVRISLDDFGTGYSSLGYLRRNWFDQLKIDKDFVADLSKDSTKQHLFKCMLTLAAGLELEVVAEGVETEKEISFIAKSGCDVVQGYYLARPCPAAQISENLLAARQALSSHIDTA